MNEIIAALTGHPFFTGIDPALLERLATVTTVKEYPAGAWVARSGAPADTFHAVLSGRAGIEIAAADRDPLLVATVHAGEMIGWSWFVEPHEWHFDVLALDPLRTLAMDAAALRADCRADHELGYQVAHRLARLLASRLVATRHQLVDVYGRGC